MSRSKDAPAAPPPDPLSRRRAAAAGVAAVLPTQIMVAPFGLLSGALSAEAGLDLLQTLALSVLVFAGASQLATLELLRQGAPALIIVATGLAINLRFTMYAAALAPWLTGMSRSTGAATAYFLVDNVFGVAVAWFQKVAADVRARTTFFIAAGLFTWTIWQIATAVGFFVGAAVPPSWSLDFAAPIAFLALALPLLNGRPSWIAAAVAATVATAFASLPFNAGVLIASVAGVAAGVAADARDRRRAGPEVAS